MSPSLILGSTKALTDWIKQGGEGVPCVPGPAEPPPGSLHALVLHRECVEALPLHNALEISVCCVSTPAR